MPNILCPAFSPCQPCPDGDPSANLSAEAPDIDTFFAIVHFSDAPPIGGSWEISQCNRICTGTTQEQADLCALALAQQCVWQGYRTAPTISDPTGKVRPVFSNSEQTCTVACPDGTSFDFIVPSGLFLALYSQANADELAHSYACKQAAAQQICLGDLFPTFACVNTFYEGSVVATGLALNDPPDTNAWTLISGALPPGLTLHGGEIEGGTATIDGTATATGTFTFEIEVESDTGLTSKVFTITVGGISTASPLPDGTTGTPYSQTLSTTRMTGAITWSVLIGPLPDGLTLDPFIGIISGTPTTPGITAFTIQAVDSAP